MTDTESHIAAPEESALRIEFRDHRLTDYEQERFKSAITAHGYSDEDAERVLACGYVAAAHALASVVQTIGGFLGDADVRHQAAALGIALYSLACENEHIRNLTMDMGAAMGGPLASEPVAGSC